MTDEPARPVGEPGAQAGPDAPAEGAGPAQDTRRRRSWQWLPALLSWVLPTVVAWFVVDYQVGRPQLWRDEIASWSVATRTVPQIFELGRHIDGVTVPYYLFLHYWIGWFGDTPTAMRLPSVIAMTATAGVAALLARRLYGNLAGLWAGLLISAAPMLSRYGQEARGYALAALFAVLATLLLVLAMDRPRWWRWVLYALSVALLGLSQQIGLLLLAGHLIAVLALSVRRGRWRLLWWALAAGAGAGALAPIALNGLGQRTAQLSWLPPASLTDLANQPGSIVGSAVVGGALCAIAAFALPRRGAADRNAGWTRLLWLSVLLPFAILYAIDQLVAPIFLPRYLIFLVPLLCVLAGAALSTLRVHTALAVGLVVAAVGLPAQVAARGRHSSADYAGVAAHLATWSQPGDGVLYIPRSSWQFTDEAMRYYLRTGRPADVLMASSEVQNASLWATECYDGVACMGRTKRVWTVIADDYAHPGLPSSLQFSQADQDALKSYRKLLTYDFSGYLVALWVPREVKNRVVKKKR